MEIGGLALLKSYYNKKDSSIDRFIVLSRKGFTLRFQCDITNSCGKKTKQIVDVTTTIFWRKMYSVISKNCQSVFVKQIITQNPQIIQLVSRARNKDIQSNTNYIQIIQTNEY